MLNVTVFRNLRALPWLAAVALLVVSLGGCGGNRSEQYRLEAESYLNLGKTSEAAALFEKAVEADPDNAMAQVGLGRCLIADGKGEQALLVFNEVIQRSPQTEGAYWEAADLLLALGRPEEAVQVASQLVRANDESGGVLLARLLVEAGRAADAVEKLTALKAERPNSVLVRTELGLAQLADGKLDEAEDELRGVVRDLTPDSVPTWMALVEVYGARGKGGDIAEEVKGLLSRSPNDENLKVVLAHAYLAAGLTSEAESLAREIVENDPRSGWANYAVGSCLLAKGAQAEAVQFLQKAAAVLPREFAVRRDLRLAERSTAGGDSALRSAQSTDTDEGAEIDEGWRSLWKEAALRDLLEGRDAYLDSGDEFVRETLVAAAVFRGDRTLASELAAGLPDDSPLHGYLNGLQSRDAEEIVTSLEPWIARQDELGLIGKNAMGYAMALFGVRAKALEFFYECRILWPENAVGIYNGAQTFRMAGMPQFAAQAYERIFTEYPGNSEGYILHFLTLRESGKMDEARRSAESAYAVFPNDVEIVLNLSQAYLDSRELSQAENVLVRALDSTSGSSRIRVGLATVYLHKGEADQSLEQLDAVPVSDDPSKRVALLQALAFLFKEDWENAIDRANAVDNQAMWPVSHMVAAAANLMTSNPDGAVAALQAASGDGFYGGKAGQVILHAVGHDTSRLTDPGDVALASALVANSEALGSFADAVALQMGELHDEAYARFMGLLPVIGESGSRLLPLVFTSLAKASRIPDTVSQARQLAEQYDASPDAWLGLASILRNAGDEEGEEQALDQAKDVAPQNPAVYLARGMFFEKRQDYPSAIPEYQKVMEIRADDPVANNNLAYCILTTGGDAEMAREHAQQALNALPNDPHVLHTLGLAELRTGNLEESRAHLEAALQRMPGEPTLLLDFGLLLVAQEKPQEGRQKVQDAVAYTDIFGLEFPRRAEAEELLRRIPPPEDPSPDAATGSRSMT